MIPFLSLSRRSVQLTLSRSRTNHLLLSRALSNGQINGRNPVSHHRLRSSTTTVPEEKKKTSKNTSSKNTSITTKDTSNLVYGSTIDHAVDLMQMRPGDRLDIPYEMTVTDAMVEFWH